MFERQRFRGWFPTLLELEEKRDRELPGLRAIGRLEGGVRHPPARGPIYALKRATPLPLLDPNLETPDTQGEGPAAALAAMPGAFRYWESPFSHLNLLVWPGGDPPSIGNGIVRPDGSDVNDIGLLG